MEVMYDKLQWLILVVFAQVDLLRLRSEAGPHEMQVEQIVSELEWAGQVTQQTLDDMLCHTPTGRRKPAGIIMERRFSRRTRRPLQSSLLSEWRRLCAITITIIKSHMRQNIVGYLDTFGFRVQTLVTVDFFTIIYLSIQLFICRLAFWSCREEGHCWGIITEKTLNRCKIPFKNQ